MEIALTFLEVQAKGQAVNYRVIHAQECIQVTLRRDDREIPLDPSVSLPTSSGMSKKGKKGKRCSQPINDQSQRPTSTYTTYSLLMAVNYHRLNQVTRRLKQSLLAIYFPIARKKKT